MRIRLILAGSIIGLLVVSNSAKAQSVNANNYDIHVINNDHSNHTTSYEMKKNGYRWNFTNEGNGKMYIHRSALSDPAMSNRTNFYSFDDFSFEARTGTIKIIQDGPYQTYAELDIRAKDKSYSDRFSLSQSSNGGAGIFNHANSDIEFGTNSSGRMWIAANGNVGIGDESPTTKFNVVGAVRASDNANEAEYIEIDHGGGNSVINHKGDGNMDFRFEGSTKMQISANGRLGIGGDFNPTHTLHVQGTGNITGAVTLGGTLTASGSTNLQGVLTATGTSNFNNTVNVSGTFITTGASQFNNQVTVGALNANQNLEVYGRAKVMELEIKPNGTWADFVFADDYELRPLEEVAAFIAENKHLPEVPTTEEVSEQGYLQTDINATLLQKIEELTLYMIDMKADNEQLRAEVAELKQQLAGQE
ncbi:MAG TPA: hypothetical protein DCE41_16710 [Cytophagales bacterium]|nr:hypothetical protein [Cytophagales bacterium]